MDRLETYNRLAAKYMEDAESLLQKGDAIQAGEKLWGSIAESVKAAGARRGLSLRTHADIWKFVLRLDGERPEEEFYTLFTIADHLHSNFYEDDLPVDAIAKALPKLKELTAKLETV